MVKFNVITGTPRSGSTLLCNLLNQRPEIYASSTSALPIITQRYMEILTNSPEITSDLTNIPEAEQRNSDTARALIETWYGYRSEEIIFDKSRLWAHQALALKELYPESLMIVLVRDPRDILASCELQHRKSALYQTAESHLLWDRCSKLVSEEGIIGGPILGIEDLIRRNLSGVMYVDYLSLAAGHDILLPKIDRALGLEEFDYNTQDVQKTATDLDPLYRNKFPHEGSGKVAVSPTRWEDVIPPDIATATLERWPLYARTFGYHI